MRLAVGLTCLTGVTVAVAVGVFLWTTDRTPREWAPFLQQRALKHRPLITGSIDRVARWLVYADRLAVAEPLKLPGLLGASADRSGPAPAGRVRLVASLPALAEATAAAQPGDVIVLQPGHYRFSGSAIRAAQSGTQDAPITVRAARLGDAVIESDGVETFKLSAPYWHFENLVMRGVCSDHANCEHAIHVVAGATDSVIRNNRFEDYNAQIKINGEDGRFPDRGIIEGNSFTDHEQRATRNPITPIDLVAASDWHISDNIITDFVRADGGGATYGAFVKGAGENNVLQRNLVICEAKLHDAAGQHIGLSLGGGGTDPTVRREQGRTGFEQVGGVIRDNLIVGCSDDGIYLNSAARSVVDHNTLLDTAGIDARFLETSATVTANIVDGVVRERDAASLRGGDNRTAYLLGLFAGLHPERAYFRDPATLDLTWRDEPALQPDAAPRIDLCGRMRADPAPPGAFSDFAPCLLGQ